LAQFRPSPGAVLSSRIIEDPVDKSIIGEGQSEALNGDLFCRGGGRRHPGAS